MENTWAKLLSLTLLKNDCKQNDWQASYHNRARKKAMPTRKLQKSQSLIWNIQLTRLIKVQEKQLISLVKQSFHWTCWMQVDHKRLLDEVLWYSGEAPFLFSFLKVSNWLSVAAVEVWRKSIEWTFSPKR